MNSKDIQYLIKHGLEDDRVRLSVISDIRNASAVAQIAFEEPELMRYSPSHIDTPDLLNSYFMNAINLLHMQSAVTFLIYDKEKEEYAGSSRYANISVKDQRVEIGWTWIGRRFQRTGLNRHKKFLMLSYAFEKAGCERIEFKADAMNQKSRMAMESIGATCEGALRSHTLMPDGSRRDTVYYSILKSEWPQVRKTRFGDF